MNRFIFLTLLLCGIAFTGYSQTNSNKEKDKSDIIYLKKGNKDDLSKFPRKPTNYPLFCVVTNEDVTVYCEYEAIGDILIVDSRTGLTVVNETKVALGEGYTVYIPESESETPLTIYVIIGDTTYWAEI